MASNGYTRISGGGGQSSMVLIGNYSSMNAYTVDVKSQINNYASKTKDDFYIKDLSFSGGVTGANQNDSVNGNPIVSYDANSGTLTLGKAKLEYWINSAYQPKAYFTYNIYCFADVNVPGVQLVDINPEKSSSIYVGVSGTSYASLPVQGFKKCALCGESYSGSAYFELKDGTTTSSFGFSTGSWTALIDIPDDAVMLKMMLSTGTYARFPVYYSLLA